MEVSGVSGADNERMSVVNETVEVVDAVEGLRAGVTGAGTSLMAGDQQLIVTHAQEVLVPTSEVQIETQPIDAVTMASMHSSPLITIPVGPPSPGGIGNKRTHTQAELTVSAAELLQSTGSSILAGTADVPRKKSRNYLDSHKTIEKKRRDRINSCLENLKTLVPDCRQYGSKKLDKAEILEMTIEYIHGLQSQGAARNAGNLDMSMGQREWANDLTTWVINNKILYNGPHALDQFCQALLLHLQGMGSGNALASATSMLLNQANSNNEEDALLRQQTVSAQAAILQHLHQQVSPTKEGNSTQQQLQQAQLTQLQALLLLQQQQQLLSQQQAQETDAQSQQSHLQQLQQLQQLQALLLQHIANEATTPTSQENASRKSGEEQGSESVSMVATSVASVEAQSSENPSVELARADELGGSVSTEETVYTSALAESLGENLLQVNVSSQSTQPAPNNAGQMWSSAGAQTGPLVMLGGGDSDGMGVEDDPGKTQLTVQEEVELLVQQEP